MLCRRSGFNTIFRVDALAHSLLWRQAIGQSTTVTNNDEWVGEVRGSGGITTAIPCSIFLELSHHSMKHRILFLPLLALLLVVAIPSRAQYPNVRVSNEADVSPDPEEVSIAVNPRNPSQLAIGANITYLYTSSNGGWAWNMQHMQSKYGFWGDPCLMYDDSGILYYEHLSGKDWQDSEFLWRIVVQRSTDAGVTFDSGEQIGLAPPTEQDKSWLGLDGSARASTGTIFTSWNEDDLYGSHRPEDSSRIFFAMSTDRGRTWSERVRVDDWGGDCVDSNNTVEGVTTASNAKGEVCIAWSGHDKIYFDRSTNGGRTFGKDRAIADQPGSWNFNVPGIFRANGFPMLMSDLNPASAFYGRMYIMWSDQRRGVTDIYFMHSEDGGTTWSKEIRVNTDNAMNHHFFPSMTVDPITGHIFLVFYDRRAYTTRETDIYLAESSDGGMTFTNSKVSESAFLPDSSVFFGDYIHLAAYDRRVFPVWMRMDPDAQSGKNHMSVWMAIIDDTMSITPPLAVAQSFAPTEELLSTTSGAQPGVHFTLPTHEKVLIELLDLLGRSVATLLTGEYGAGEYHIGLPSATPNGTYLVRMTSTPRSQKRSIEKVVKLSISR